MKNTCSIISMLLLLASCMSTQDQARLYFRRNNFKGVEPYESMMERMKKDQQLRDIMYGQAQAARLLQCTLLRNQLYVAVLKTSASSDIIEATKLMEDAFYQSDDEIFLTTCEQVMSTPIGKAFLTVQQEEMSR